MDRDTYIKQLEVCLHNHPQLPVIVAELHCHMNEKHKELMLLGFTDIAAWKQVLAELGEPKDLASQYRKLSLWTPQKAFHLCICFNYLSIFVVLLLMIASLVYPSPFITQGWNLLIQWKWMLLIAYSILWTGIGFWWGDKFGVKSQTLIQRQYFVWLPNFILMLSVLYFSPFAPSFLLLLTPDFVTISSVFTILLIPMLGWGYHRGVSHL